MFGYYTRLTHTYPETVVSFAILADSRPGWRPGAYTSERWGCRVEFSFPMVKLIDLAPGDPSNPFAVVVDAYLQARQTQKDPEARLVAKLRLAKSLYRQGWQRADVVNLYTFIDWALGLPDDLDAGFRHDLRVFEEENQMPYVSTAVRIGMEKGLEQGRLEGEARFVQRQLVLKFQPLPPWVTERLSAATAEELMRWGDRILFVDRLEAVFE